LVVVLEKRGLERWEGNEVETKLLVSSCCGFQVRQELRLFNGFCNGKDEEAGSRVTQGRIDTY
jgi:hypothetical protein